MTAAPVFIERTRRLLALALAKPVTPAIVGRVTHVAGTLVKAALPDAKVGEMCTLVDVVRGRRLAAEVVGVYPGGAMLAPFGSVEGLGGFSEVLFTGQPQTVAAGPQLLGRVLNAMAQPLDGSVMPTSPDTAFYPIAADPPSPFERSVITEPLALGVKAIDAFITCGEGQRVGIFAAAGGGKSTLLAMLARGAQADVVVLALIGERGREVREFLDRELGPEVRARCVVVCATSDRSAMERVRAAHVGTAIAEYFRDQGKKVLFLMDSVTRYARAQREIGLAAGEPPTRRGFPPSVFANLPKLVERTGMSAKGSITSFYTVLVEGDDMTEPVADEVRSLLDGHIVLSRKLAERNHYPAIDVLASTSRLMRQIVTPRHIELAGNLRTLMATHAEVELLVRIGEYKSGSDARADEAIAKNEAIEAFLRQGSHDACHFSEMLEQMDALAR